MSYATRKHNQYIRAIMGGDRRRSMTIMGTPNFVSIEKATQYYLEQCYGEDLVEARAIVQEKLDAGEIYIGKPEMPKGSKLILIDKGARYGIEDPG